MEELDMARIRRMNAAYISSIAITSSMSLMAFVLAIVVWESSSVVVKTALLVAIVFAVARSNMKAVRLYLQETRHPSCGR